MLFLKFLTMIFINLVLGMLPFMALVVFLFYPNKPLRWRGKQLPGTPAFLYRQKNKYINKLHRWLHDYLQDSASSDPETSIAQWEDKAYRRAYEKFQFISDFAWLPRFIKEPLHNLLATFFYEIVRQFLRNLVPFLLEKYQLSSYIDLLDKKLDLDILREFINQKILKYVFIILLIFYGLIGLLNGFLFLILK
ncbi:MAG: hypothetical protein R6U84_04740 [Candidatus Cloacimonadales bacterium]